MDVDVIVSKTHGMNISLAKCTRCGSPTGELLLLGKTNEYKCLACGSVIFGNSPRNCPDCNSPNVALIERDAKAPKFLSHGLCDTCKEEMENFRAAVRQGGIFWRCKDCGSEGVIKPGRFLALMARCKMGIVAPKPCGIEFTRDECPVCRKQ
ncbi:MAG: hypothetical protein IMF11_15945 [Proteobacteria bacterium]|nr:hypothetical protein [Pseudomonadota bacterium]